MEERVAPGYGESPFERQLKGDYQIDAFGFVQQGWQLFRQQTINYIGFSILVLLVTVPLALPGLLFTESYPEYSVLFTMVKYAGTGISVPLYAGYYTFAFRQMSGHEVSFRDFFRGFSYLFPLLLAALLSYLLILGGTMLFVLPGIYLAVSYYFIDMLIIDHRMNFWQAMETSRQVVTKRWFSIFWYLIVIALVNMLGALSFGIGLIVSFPVSFCAGAVAYREIFGFNRDDW